MGPVAEDAGGGGPDADEGDCVEGTGSEPGSEDADADGGAALHGQVVHGDGATVLAGGDGGKNGVVDGGEEGTEAGVDEADTWRQ